jgi:hypothetical protein
MDTWKAEVRRRAEEQAGRVAWWQLIRCGAVNSEALWWIKNGRLVRVAPHVYALGSAVPSYHASLWEAILYAGPGASLSHGTAAEWLGYTSRRPKAIHVSTPRKIPSLKSKFVVHARRDLPWQIVKGLPVTTPEQTALDLSASAPLDDVRYALAQMDFKREFNLNALRAISGKGKPGSKVLHEALAAHQPKLAQTNGKLELDFFLLLERWGFEPLPEPNYKLEPDLTIDAVWPAYRFAVETDGKRGHGSDARVLLDRRRERACRRLGFSTPIRYAWEQIHGDPADVCDDLLTQLSAAAYRYNLPKPVVRRPPQRLRASSKRVR